MLGFEFERGGSFTIPCGCYTTRRATNSSLSNFGHCDHKDRAGLSKVCLNSFVAQLALLWQVDPLTFAHAAGHCRLMLYCCDHAIYVLGLTKPPFNAVIFSFQIAWPSVSIQGTVQGADVVDWLVDLIVQPRGVRLRTGATRELFRVT